MEPSDLYGVPLDRFVAERTALARSLKADGRREEADQVAALRKPSVAAWAVNQLVRTQRSAVKRLFDAGDSLSRAQSELLAGRGDAVALRAANQARRDALQGLVELARGLLSSSGSELTPAVLERVTETLNAAALDDTARAAVRDGCLERELRHVGLGDAPVLAAPAGGSSKAAERDAARKAAEERKALEARRRVLERAERDVAAAEERVERAREALRDADAALAAARERVSDLTSGS